MCRHVVHDETVFPFSVSLSLPSSPSPMLRPGPFFGSPSTVVHALVDSLLASILPQEIQFINDLATSYNNHSMLTRAKNEIFKKENFDEFCAYSCIAKQNVIDELSFFSGLTFVLDITNVVEPKHFKVVVGHTEWDTTMNEEVEALQKQGTWILVPMPKEKNIVGSKWVYKIKRNPDGSVSRYKARLVAQGYNQEKGLDYDETFSHVLRHSTVRIVLALATMFKWELRQLDVKNVFLHGDLKEEVYMQQPMHGFC